MLLYGDPLPSSMFPHQGTLVPHPDAGFVGIQLPNGRFACLTPDGFWEERDHLQSWERFTKGPNYLFAERNGRGFVITFAEGA